MDYSDFTVVLPTLNEDKNIEILIKNIIKKYNRIKILVVDDGSFDNTRKIVKSLIAKNSNIKLFDRSNKGLKKGLTASIIDGIRLSETRFVIVMDADLQHPYALIEEIALNLNSGNKLVVAVRNNVKDWDLYRRIISKLLISIAYLILYLKKKSYCDDIFSGFFGIEKKYFQGVFKKNKKRFVLEGYKVLFDFLKCIPYNDLKPYQLPYIFQSRKYGSSKVGLRQGIALLKSFFS